MAMDLRNHQERYRGFLDYIGKEAQHERRAVNRRMFSVFLWCFLAPSLLAITLLLLIKLSLLPHQARAYLDWLVLVFPVAYSIYFLSSEVLKEAPAAFRRGGIANVLQQSAHSALWRERVVDELDRSLGGSVSDWSWIIANFEMDLRAMQNRTRHLTGLAGAVFFLIMQGIDSITGVEPPSVWTRHAVLGWVETSTGNLSQFVGLGLFLVLLYLSGSQTYHHLKRFLDCAELVRLKKSQK